MKNSTLLVVILSAIVTISSIYITQPIHPLFVEIFGVSIAQVTLFTSVVLLSLAFAPLVYGYLLEKFPLRPLLSFSLTALGSLQCLLCFSQNYAVFLILRILEACIIPLALTASLTTLARLDSQRIQRNVSLYVAATIFGGALSRIGSGFMTSLFSWQTTFALLGVVTLGVALMSYSLPKSEGFSGVKITLKVFRELLEDRRYLLVYVGAFLVLFCFQAVLNLMPFAMIDSNPQIPTAAIGFLYLGYVIGIIVALLSRVITRLFGGELNAIILGFAIFAVAVFFMTILHYWWMFFTVFVLCAGMFIVHSVLSGLVNSLQREKKGVTNGLYLAFYYTGGACGTILPSYYYEILGWEVLCCVLGGILLGSAWLFHGYRKVFKEV